MGLVSWLFVLSVGLREVEGENGTRLEGEEGREGGKRGGLRMRISGAMRYSVRSY